MYPVWVYVGRRCMWRGDRWWLRNRYHLELHFQNMACYPDIELNTEPGETKTRLGACPTMWRQISARAGGGDSSPQIKLWTGGTAT